MGGFLNPLGAIHRAIGLGMVVVIVALLAWSLRLDSLRAAHKDAVALILQPLEHASGMKPKSLKAKQGPEAVRKLATSRDAWIERAAKNKRERDNAREVIRLQSSSILKYEAETKRLRQISKDQSKLAASLIADRKTWIDKAKAATSRSERALCETEIKEVEDVLNALYQADF